MGYRCARRRRRGPARRQRHRYTGRGGLRRAVCRLPWNLRRGRRPLSQTGRRQGNAQRGTPEPTVGSYWPFAPTLWDYINRAMPMPTPHTLSADDVYALTAYILHLNDIVSGDFVADRDSLPRVKMPNGDSFVWIEPRPDTMATPGMAACT